MGPRARAPTTSMQGAVAAAGVLTGFNTKKNQKSMKSELKDAMTDAASGLLAPPQLAAAPVRVQSPWVCGTCGFENPSDLKW